MDAAKLAKDYKDLEKGFESIRGAFHKIVENAGEFLGFHFVKFKEHSVRNNIWGFGYSLMFGWRFVIHEGEGVGVLGVSCLGRLPCDSEFYEIFFRCNGGVPVIQRALDQQTGDFYGNQVSDMEKLLKEIIETFLAQGRFTEIINPVG